MVRDSYVSLETHRRRAEEKPSADLRVTGWLQRRKGIAEVSGCDADIIDIEPFLSPAETSKKRNTLPMLMPPMSMSTSIIILPLEQQIRNKLDAKVHERNALFTKLDLVNTEIRKLTLELQAQVLDGESG